MRWTSTLCEQGEGWVPAQPPRQPRQVAVTDKFVVIDPPAKTIVFHFTFLVTCWCLLLFVVVVVVVFPLGFLWVFSHICIIISQKQMLNIRLERLLIRTQTFW